MPVAIPVRGRSIFAVTIRGRLYDQVTMTVLNYAGTGSEDYPNVAAVYGEIKDQINKPGGVMSKMADFCSVDQKFDYIDVQVIYPDRVGPQSFSPFFLVGNDPAAALPSNECAVIGKRTGLSTKRSEENGVGYTGIAHIPGVPRPSVTGDFLSDAKHAQLQSLGDSLAEPLALPSFDPLNPVLYHRDSKTEEHHTVWTTAVAAKDVRVMRRRTFRVGI